MPKKNIYFIENNKYFSAFQKLYQCKIKLQTKIQITQRHNESIFKNIYRKKEINVKGKI